MLTISVTVIWFQRAVANTSMRLAEPSRPTIWAPSSRPERRSASTLIVIGSASGGVAAPWRGRPAAGTRLYPPRLGPGEVAGPVGRLAHRLLPLQAERAQLGLGQA